MVESRVGMGGGLQLQRRRPVRGHRNTEHPPPIAQHEIDHLRGYLFGGADKVAFVLTSLVIDDDNHPSSGDRFDGLLYRCKTIL